MELRLYPYNWVEDNLVISFDNSNINTVEKDLLGKDTKELYDKAQKIFLEQFKLIVGDPKQR